ncbi:MAG TPA: hypothetical protein VIY72_15795 [Acidimicrobiales bacterium]
MADPQPVGDAADALRTTHEWFEHNSGWAPPDVETVAEWLSDGVCRAPDECLVPPRGWCAHGLASWWLVLDDLGDIAELPIPPP